MKKPLQAPCPNHNTTDKDSTCGSIDNGNGETTSADPYMTAEEVKVSLIQALCLDMPLFDGCSIALFYDMDMDIDELIGTVVRCHIHTDILSKQLNNTRAHDVEFLIPHTCRKSEFETLRMLTQRKIIAELVIRAYKQGAEDHKNSLRNAFDFLTADKENT